MPNKFVSDIYAFALDHRNNTSLFWEVFALRDLRMKMSTAAFVITQNVFSTLDGK